MEEVVEYKAGLTDKRSGDKKVKCVNKHASALGKMSKGKPKNLSQEEKQKRSERLRIARQKRWNTDAQPPVKSK